MATTQQLITAEQPVASDANNPLDLPSVHPLAAAWKANRRATLLCSLADIG